MNRLYPVFLKLSEKPVLVVGGGAMALRRIEGLLAAGARVTVVSPEAVAAIEQLAALGRLGWRRRRFEPADVEGAALVVSATGDRDALLTVRQATAARGILLSAAEDEALGDLHVPATAIHGDVQLAVSTGGASPAGAARIRDLVARWLEGHGPAVEEAVALGRRPPAGSRGKVYLVGAGPGDPGLLTLRAAELLRRADLVLHDRLVSSEVLALASPRAERVYVGKEVGCTLREDTGRRMIEGARQGKLVVRLKGGDPLVFGRAVEEIAACVEAGVDHEIVPGVSALNAVPAAAGIPITCRGVASEVIVRSGHAPPPRGTAVTHPAPPVERTYVYFMAARHVAEAAEEMQAEGVPGWTPVALVQRGTMPGQKVIEATLETIAAAAAEQPIETPALLVAGQVVRLRDPRQLLPSLTAAWPEEEDA